MPYSPIQVHELAATDDAPMSVFYDTSALDKERASLLSPAHPHIGELVCAFELIGEPDKPLVIEHEEDGLQVAITEHFDDIVVRQKQRFNPTYAQKVVRHHNSTLNPEQTAAFAEKVLVIAQAGMRAAVRSTLHEDSEMITGMVESYLNSHLPSEKTVRMQRIASAVGNNALAA